MNLTNGENHEDIEEVFNAMNLPVFKIVMETAPIRHVRTVFDFKISFFVIWEMLVENLMK